MSVLHLRFQNTIRAVIRMHDIVRFKKDQNKISKCSKQKFLCGDRGYHVIICVDCFLWIDDELN